MVKVVGMHLTRAGAVPVTKAISFENSIKRRFTAKSCSQRHKKGRRIREIVLTVGLVGGNGAVAQKWKTHWAAW